MFVTMERAGTAVTLHLLITQDGMFSLGFVPNTKAIWEPQNTSLRSSISQPGFSEQNVSNLKEEYF